MDKQYYNEYYHIERDHWWFKARMEILEVLVQKHFQHGKRELKILNVGVATGATSIMLQKYGEVTSLEYDKECCEFLRETVHLDVINGSLTELPFEDHSYDLVCAFDVIEHIENDQLAVAEMYRVLNKGGYMFVTVPAFQSIWSKHDVINHHFRRYKMEGLKQLALNEKFEIVRKSYFNFILFPPIFIFRIILNTLKRKQTTETVGSDFDFFKKKKLLNTILYTLFKVEKPVLKLNINFPFGVSAFLIGKK